MEIDVKKIIGNNVKRLREYKDLSQERFAESIGLQVQAISLMENCKTYPLPETMSNICNKYNLSPAVLYTVADYFSKQKLSSKQELIKAINISLTELEEDKLQFTLDFIALLTKQNLK